MSAKKHMFIKGLPLFLIIFIDSMGLGLFFPIVNGLIMLPKSGFLASNITLTVRQFDFSLIIGTYMLCWFLGAPILGDLSDNAGRKKILFVCLLGSFLGYFISAIAVSWHKLWLLVLGRIIAGFTAGSQSIAQAAIVDISSTETLPGNMGLILLSVSLGFVFGPIVGGMLSNHNLISWFNFTTPLYFIALLSVINLILLLILFKETLTSSGKIKIKLYHAIAIFISAFTHTKITRLSIVFLIMILGWSCFFNFLLLYLNSKYHISAFMGAIFMSGLGIGFSIGCGYLTQKLADNYKLKSVVISGFLITSLSILLIILVHIKIITWLLLIIIGSSLGYAYSNITVMFSKSVNAHEQGWVMGVIGAIMSLSFGITAFLVPMLSDINNNIPFWMAFVFILASALLLANKKYYKN